MAALAPTRKCVSEYGGDRYIGKKKDLTNRRTGIPEEAVHVAFRDWPGMKGAQTGKLPRPRGRAGQAWRVPKVRCEGAAAPCIWLRAGWLEAPGTRFPQRAGK